MTTNRQIEEYDLLTSPTATGLVKVVNQSIKRGFQPFGSGRVQKGWDGFVYTQTVVKYKETTD